MESFIFTSVECSTEHAVSLMLSVKQVGLKCTSMVQAVLRPNSQRQKVSSLRILE